MGKRIVLFLITNALVIATIAIVTNLLGLHGYLTRQGINYQALLIFATLWGMGGSLISLFISKWMAKAAMGVKIIDPKHAGTNERRLIDLVHRLARKTGLSKMPEVGIYDSPELNAFATGPSKHDALVAVSTGLLENMEAEEVEGVLGHEVTHIANGDMVTMMLIQGVINSFALFLSRIVAYIVSMAVARGDNEEGGMSYGLYFLLSFVFDILFTVLGSIVTATFSRWREFRADAGGARLAGKSKMIAALERLKLNTEAVQDKRGQALQTLKISQPTGIMALFASHPPLEVRIKRLQGGK